VEIAGRVTSKIDQIARENAKLLEEQIRGTHASDLTAPQLQEQLEATAVLLALDRVSQWKDWTLTLAEKTADGQIISAHYYADVLSTSEMIEKHDMLSFKQVFLRSRTIELILEGVVNDPPDDEPYNAETKPSWFQPLIDLLGYCFIGDSGMHTSLLDTLFSVLKEFAADSKIRPEITKQVIAATASTYKKDWRVEGVMQRLEKLKSILAQKDEEFAHLVEDGKGDPSTLLQDRTMACSALLQANQRLRESVQEALSLMDVYCVPKDGPEALYSNINKSIDQWLEELERLQGELAARREGVIRQQTEAEAFQNTKRQDYEEHGSGITSEINQLLARKRQLEAELSEVNSSLNTLRVKQKRNEDDYGMFVDQYGEMLGSLSLQEAELASGIDSVKLDARNVKAVQTFIGEYANVLGILVERGVDSLKQRSEDAASQFLVFTERHIRNYKDHLTLLCRLLKFCKEELTQKELKRKEMEEVGMKEMINEIMAGTDKLKAKRYEAVNTYKRVSKEVEDVISEYKSFQTTTDPLVRALPRILECSEKVDNLVSSVASLRNEISTYLPPPEELAALAPPVLPTSPLLPLKLPTEELDRISLSVDSINTKTAAPPKSQSSSSALPVSLSFNSTTPLGVLTPTTPLAVDESLTTAEEPSPHLGVDSTLALDVSSLQPSAGPAPSSDTPKVPQPVSFDSPKTEIPTPDGSSSSSDDPVKKVREEAEKRKSEAETVAKRAKEEAIKRKAEAEARLKAAMAAYKDVKTPTTATPPPASETTSSSPPDPSSS